MGDNFPDTIQWTKGLITITKFLVKYFDIVFYYYVIEQTFLQKKQFINIWKNVTLAYVTNILKHVLWLCFKESSCFKIPKLLKENQNCYFDMKSNMSWEIVHCISTILPFVFLTFIVYSLL